MSGERDLSILLHEMAPKLWAHDLVFCTIPNANDDEFAHLRPLMRFREQEGMTLIVEQSQAEAAALRYTGVFRCIVLTVHSDLEAVGLTAAVSTALANENISANMVAGFFHDYVFVPKSDAKRALSVLEQLSSGARS